MEDIEDDEVSRFSDGESGGRDKNSDDESDFSSWKKNGSQLFEITIVFTALHVSP
jgi:hypothetical protein